MRSQLGLALVTAFAIGCTALPEDEASATSTESDLVANVLANTAKVEDDRLVFPTTSFPKSVRERIVKNDERVILVGDRQANATDASGQIRDGLDNPFGFIRRAVSIRDEGDKTIVMTEPATLEDALEEFDAEQTIEIGTRDPETKTGNVKPRLAFDKRASFEIPVVRITNKDIYRKGDAFVRIKSASITVDTSVDLGVNIALLKGLTHAHARIAADLQSELILEAGGEKAFEGSAKADVFKGSWPIGAIGPVAITLALKATVGCEAGATGTFTTAGGITTSMRTGGGMAYDRGQGVRSSFESPRFAASVVKPAINASATGNAKCYVRPEISLLFAGVAGPLVAPEGYAKIEGAVVPPPLKASLDVGLTVDIGGKLSVFGRDLGSLPTKEVWSYEKELWHL